MSPTQGDGQIMDTLVDEFKQLLVCLQDRFASHRNGTSQTVIVFPLFLQSLLIKHNPWALICMFPITVCFRSNTATVKTIYELDFNVLEYIS